MNSSMPGSNVSVHSDGARTIADAISTTEMLHQHLLDAAAVTERIANMLGGPVPEAPSGAQKGDPNGGCMVDHLNLRMDALRDPAIRITSALARIERRLG